MNYSGTGTKNHNFDRPHSSLHYQTLATFENPNRNLYFRLVLENGGGTRTVFPILGYVAAFAAITMTNFCYHHEKLLKQLKNSTTRNLILIRFLFLKINLTIKDND
jgi:hypothetical protein